MSVHYLKSSPAQGGAPLTARDALAASPSEREATTSIIDYLLFQMYALSEDEIAIIRGTDAPNRYFARQCKRAGYADRCG